MKIKITLLLGIICSLPSTIQAFSTNQALNYATPSLSIEKQGTTIDVTYTYQIQNTTEEAQSFQFLYPLLSGTNNAKIFLESDGVSADIQSGTKKRETLWELAKKQQDPSWLRWGNDKTPSILVGVETTIPKSTTWDVKVQYTVPTEQINEWNFFNGMFPLSLDESKINITYPNGEYFFSNIPNTNFLIPKNNDGRTYLETVSVLDSNIWMGWSSSLKPLKQTYEGFSYEIHPQAPISFAPEYITLLIDTSGSITPAQWQKSVETIRFLLNTPLENKHIQIGLFDEDITWLETKDDAAQHQINTFERRQALFEELESIRPLGKTDLETILNDSTLQEHIVENHALILITDEIGLEIPFSTPTAILHLGNDSQRSTWQSFTNQTQNWLHPLFSVESLLIESQDIENLLSLWIQNPIEFISVKDLVDTHTIITNSHSPQAPYTIGRVLRPSSIKTVLSWIPQKWAQLQTKQLENKTDKTQADQDSIDSIRTVFGQKENQQWVNTVPSYEADNRWETYSFPTNNIPNTTLALAPFSEATQYLYMNFPEQVAEGLSVGLMSNFCTQTRCLNIIPEGETDVTSFVKAYWSEKDQNHWALPYVQPLVKSGEYPLNENGGLELEKAINRGDFIQMMYNRIPTHKWRKGSPLIFLDLPESNPYFEAISWFSEHNIISGYSDETVRPENPLSRAEAVKIMLATDGYKAIEDEEPLFQDSLTWELPWVNEAQRRGYVNGFTETQFKPHTPLTKGQAAKLITKFFK